MRNLSRIAASLAAALVTAQPSHSASNLGPHFEIPDRDVRIYRARPIDKGRMVAMEVPIPIGVGDGRTLIGHVALETGVANPPKYSLGKNKLCSDLVTIVIDPNSIENIKPLRFRTLFEVSSRARADYTFSASPDGSLFARCHPLLKTCDVISLNKGWDSEIVIDKGDLCYARGMSEKLKEKVEPWFRAG